MMDLSDREQNLAYRRALLRSQEMLDGTLEGVEALSVVDELHECFGVTHELAGDIARVALNDAIALRHPDANQL